MHLRAMLPLRRSAFQSSASVGLCTETIEIACQSKASRLDLSDAEQWESEGRMLT